MNKFYDTAHKEFFSGLTYNRRAFLQEQKLINVIIILVMFCVEYFCFIALEHTLKSIHFKCYFLIAFLPRNNVSNLGGGGVAALDIRIYD